MKIKEVENRVGMTRANIRYYEKEGLLNTTIRNENNYREYTEEDVEQLQRIKILRLLGVTPADIKLLNADAISMEEIMQKRKEEIERQARELQDIQRICDTIIDKKIDVHSLNEEVLTGDQEVWKLRLENLLNKDIVNEVITKKQVNKTIAGMLSWGYLLSAAVTMVLYAIEESRTNLLFGNDQSILGVGAIGVVLIISLFAAYYTANVMAHLVTFHISAVFSVPLVLGILRFLTGARKGQHLIGEISLIQLSVFWCVLALYIVLLYVLAEKWDGIFTRLRYVLLVAVGFSSVFALIMGLTFEYWITMSVLMVYFTVLIATKWVVAITDRKTYNRYYAVRHAACMINVMGLNILSVGDNNKF